MEHSPADMGLDMAGMRDFALRRNISQILPTTQISLARFFFQETPSIQQLYLPSAQLPFSFSL
jgi:hypothetical protein